MNSKIFGIFFAFSTIQILLVESTNKIPEIRLSNEEQKKINDILEGFADVVLLTEAKELWNIKTSKKTFQKCYTKPKKEEYKTAIVNFNFETLEEGSVLNRNLPTYFKERVKNVRKQINELGNHMKDYHRLFSEKVEDGNLGAIQTLIEEYKPKIENSFKEFYTQLLGIHQTTNVQSDYQAINSIENAFKEKIEEIRKECEKVITKIKECMKIKN